MEDKMDNKKRARLMTKKLDKTGQLRED